MFMVELEVAENNAKYKRAIGHYVVQKIATHLLRSQNPVGFHAALGRCSTRKPRRKQGIEDAMSMLISSSAKLQVGALNSNRGFDVLVGCFWCFRQRPSSAEIDRIPAALRLALCSRQIVANSVIQLLDRWML